jgi:hypothetical protein
MPSISSSEILPRKASVKTGPQDTFSEQLLCRICGEFLEMPGLHLTRPQARRLWALDEETCTRILDLLVEIRFLCLTGLDTYARLTEGPVAFPRLPVANSTVDGTFAFTGELATTDVAQRHVKVM